MTHHVFQSCCKFCVVNIILSNFQPIKKKKVDASTFCGFCRGTAQCNKDGEEEELISCADCGNSGRFTLKVLCTGEGPKIFFFFFHLLCTNVVYVLLRCYSQNNGLK